MTIVNFSERPEITERDVCIIGAGPIGIALALACEARGLSVLLVESGRFEPDTLTGKLSRATIADGRFHAPMEIAVCRALGGTSHWWGGRCVAFDDIDFVSRSPLTGAEWPLAHEEIKKWYGASASFLRCGSAVFSKPTSSGHAGDAVKFDSIERWVSETNLATVYRAELERSEEILVVLGAAATDLQFARSQKRIDSIVVADMVGAQTINVRTCIVACGGLETTRLLLVAQRQRPDTFGGRDGPLGRYYTGHISGKLADIVFDRPEDAIEYDFVRDGQAFLRRRFAIDASTLKRERLLNIAFWIDNPPFYDPSHGSGVLSLAWLALAMPVLGRRLLPEAVRRSHLGPRPLRFFAHAANIVGHPFATVVALERMLRDRYLRKPGNPGFLVRNRAGRYALHYHAQQTANPASRVVLSDETDALGMPRLRIEFSFSKEDASSVVRAHEVLESGLKAARFGNLEYRVDVSKKLDHVMQQASDGFHQTGTTRMGLSPGMSVVDANCRVHGIDNLFVASTSVFPTSGQANPTFLGVAMAFRLASFLSSQHRSQRADVPQQTEHPSGAELRKPASG